MMMKKVLVNTNNIITKRLLFYHHDGAAATVKYNTIHAHKILLLSIGGIHYIRDFPRTPSNFHANI